MKEKNIILAARIMSMLFTPFYLPLVGLVALFLFSYMSLLPLAYKLPMLLMVYISTILMPSLLIHLYRKFQGWTSKELGRKERRVVPYLISILCYFGCFFLMEYRNTPRVISIILVSYSVAFDFNPLWWLCIVLLMAGSVGSARMILRQHTLSQVVAGFLIGTACAILVI